jgi:hypothetical protein
MWCIAEITPEYRERMYRLLDLYREEYDPGRPVVCIDEKSKQLIEEIRKPIPLKPGRTAKYDYEYIRRGTRNIFVAVEPKGGSRTVTVTKTRKKNDFARFVRNLVKNRYPKAVQIRIVLDNLNTHFESSFYESFSKEEADQILSKVAFYYTPKHASWLNMAEIEINIMSRECLGSRIGNEHLLKQQIKSWAKERNKLRKQIIWKFTKQDADKKLSAHYAP